MNDLGLLILRLAVGLILAAHGAQKLFGWFGGPGIDGWSSILGHMGIRPAPFWAWFHALTEFAGGLMLAIGVLTPVAAASLSAVMGMAIIKAHWSNGFFNKNGGIEFPLGLLAGLIAIGLSGPGAFALAPKALFGWHPVTLFLIALALGGLFDGLALASISINTSQHRVV